MGRRRSKVLALSQRLAHLKEQRQKGFLHPPWNCPICFERTVWYKKKGKLIMIFCQKENLGEVFPIHPTFKLPDYAQFFFDKRLFDVHKDDKEWINLVQNYQEPVFRFTRMSKTELENMKKRITVGKIEVEEILEQT